MPHDRETCFIVPLVLPLKDVFLPSETSRSSFMSAQAGQSEFLSLTTEPDFFWGAPKSLQMVIAAMKLKDAYFLEGKL